MMTTAEHRSAQRALQRLAGTRAPLGQSTGRRPMRTYAAILAAIVLLGLAGASDRASAASREATCYEGMQCWQWPIMGNYKRGIVTVGGRHLVVGPCRYQRIRLAERIDHKRTRQLLGDSLAAFAGCRMTRDRATGNGSRWRG